MNVSFGISGNSKTGKMPVSTSSKETCSDDCPLKESGCYAKYSFLGMHWNKVTSGEHGTSWSTFVDNVAKLADGTIWRHNQAGDLAGKNNTIDTEKLMQLVEANKGKMGFTYTHKKMTEKNKKLIRYANTNGFTINLSANNDDHADSLVSLNIAPVVLLVSHDAESYTTNGGNKVIICPEQTKGINCVECKLCARSNRKTVIGFRAHGTAKKQVELIASSNVYGEQHDYICQQRYHHSNTRDHHTWS